MRGVRCITRLAVATFQLRLEPYYAIQTFETGANTKLMLGAGRNGEENLKARDNGRPWSHPPTHASRGALRATDRRCPSQVLRPSGVLPSPCEAAVRRRIGRCRCRAGSVAEARRYSSRQPWLPPPMNGRAAEAVSVLREELAPQGK